jgi:hypothetical protein
VRTDGLWPMALPGRPTVQEWLPATYGVKSQPVVTVATASGGKRAMFQTLETRFRREAITSPLRPYGQESGFHSASTPNISIDSLL